MYLNDAVCVFVVQVEREQLQKCFGCELHNMLCIPVESRSDQSHVIALFCAFNKRTPPQSASNSHTPTHSSSPHTLTGSNTLLNSTSSCGGSQGSSSFATAAVSPAVGPPGTVVNGSHSRSGSALTSTTTTTNGVYIFI